MKLRFLRKERRKMEQYKPDVIAQYMAAFAIWSNSSDKESVEKLFETFTGMSLEGICKIM